MQNDNLPNQDAAANSDNSNTQTPSVMGVVQPPSEPVQEQPTPPQSLYPQSNTATNGQMQVGVSASQMGWSQSSGKKSFNIKKLAIDGVLGLVILGSIFAVLVFTNIIVLSRLKTLGYTNSKGTQFRVTFYAKHSSKQLQSGNNQLVSKVSKDDKFPVTLSISDGTDGGYARVKDCSSFTKVFDVQNNNLNQTISVCDFGKQGNLPAGGVYVAGFTKDNQSYVVTIGQDYSGIDLTSQSGAQQSIERFGLDSYQDDIKMIVASIKVE